jgi:hypothetical protein
MDDPGWSWPAWKFGMKRDDLFTSLHDRYNTFSSTIQDPEAFHHDVYEISRDADSSDEFHRMMADRQRQRLHELHESLESLAVEIIANPKLMASDQWQHALQLFRTKSFDSIVRFFASYLPDEYLDRHDHRSTSSSFSETNSVYTTSTKASSVGEEPCHFLDDDFFPNGPAMTEEPCTLDHDVHSDPAVDAPLSPPESETMQSVESVSSPTDVESHGYSATNPPSPSMSFSGSELGAFGTDLTRRSYIHDDETSQSSDCDSAVTSVSDCGESRSSFDPVDDKELPEIALAVEDEDDDFPTAQFPEEYLDFFDTPDDTLESDTPTPRQEGIATGYVEYKSIASRRLPSPHRRSLSPSPKTHLSHRSDGMLLRGVRRSPEEALSKIQKPIPDFSKRRPKGRKRMDC